MYNKNMPENKQKNEKSAHTPEISVIIPVYNSENRLPFCLDSIQKQTFKNFEIIAVNDGSTDNSLKILENYAARDSRIRIITQKNSGPAAARNRGLDEATGKWIIMPDSDDYLEPDTFEQALYAAKKNNATMIQWGYINEYENISIPILHGNDHFITFKNKPGTICLVAWDKMIMRDIIGQIRFPEDMFYFEDSVFIFLIYMISPVSFFINRPFYHYRIHENSLSQPLSGKHMEYVKDGIARLQKIVTEAGRENECSETILLRKFYAKLLCMKVFNPPDIELARKTFPEVNRYFFKIHGITLKILFLLLYLRMDTVIKLGIHLYFSRHNRPRPFKK